MKFEFCLIIVQLRVVKSRVFAAAAFCSRSYFWFWRSKLPMLVRTPFQLIFEGRKIDAFCVFLQASEQKGWSRSSSIRKHLRRRSFSSSRIDQVGNKVTMLCFFLSFFHPFLHVLQFYIWKMYSWCWMNDGGNFLWNFHQINFISCMCQALKSPCRRVFFSGMSEISSTYKTILDESLDSWYWL